MGFNREAGASPARSRRCNRGRNLHTPLFTRREREGPGIRMIRESEDLPVIVVPLPNVGLGQARPREEW
jgi:hypothetical protein